MKNIILPICMLLSFNSVYAQEFEDYLAVTREVLKVEKKVLINEVMQLTPEENAPFWELYNEYESKKQKINSSNFKLIKEYIDNYGSMTDDKAYEILTAYINIRYDLEKLRRSYLKKFLKILPPRKALKFFQAENKIKAMIDAEIAMQLPFLDEIEE